MLENQSQAAMKKSKTNLLDFYKKHLKSGKKTNEPSEEDRIRMVFEYLVFNHTGGNFLDVMKSIEEIKEGNKIEYLEE